jgi:hypothetical protein
MSPLEVLRGARALLARGHTTKAAARNASGRAVAGHDPTAVRWSVGGAIAASDGGDPHLGLKAFNYVRLVFEKHEAWAGDVAGTQDLLSKEEVLALMDRAIAAASGTTKRRTA